MADEATATFRLLADASQLDEVLGGVKKKFAAVARQVSAVALPVGIVGAAAKVASALAAIGEEGINTIAPLADVAEQLGLTAERLQELHAIGKQAGVDFAQMDKSLSILNKTVGQAALGNGDFEKTLAAAGISLRNQEGQIKSVSTVYSELSRVISSGSLSHAQSIALAASAFGREGGKMVAVLRQTDEQQRAVIDTARQYGAIISNDVVAAADQYADKLDLIKQGTEALAAQNELLLAPLTLKWAALKNEIAGAVAQFLNAVGVTDDDVMLQRRRMKQIGDTMTRLNESARVTGMNDSTRNQLDVLYAEWKDLNEKVRATEDAARAAAEAKPPGASEESDPVESDSAAKERLRAETEAAKERARIAKEAADYELELTTAVYAEQDRLAQLEIDQFADYATTLAAEKERVYTEELKQLQDWNETLAEERERAAEMEIEQYLEKEGLLTQARRDGQKARAEFDKLSSSEQIATTIGALETITAGVAQHSKKMFQINKLAAIATAIVNTAQGATKALAQGGFAGIAQAAAVIAAGTAQIAAIRKTTFQGGGQGTTPSAVNTPVVNGQPVQNQVITVKGVNANQLFSGRQLVELLNEATKSGAKLVLAQ